MKKVLGVGFIYKGEWGWQWRERVFWTIREGE
jgi:hypothetical protein